MVQPFYNTFCDPFLIPTKICKIHVKLIKELATSVIVKKEHFVSFSGFLASAFASG